MPYGLVSQQNIRLYCLVTSHGFSSLEINVRQLILADLAENIRDFKDDEPTSGYLSAIDLVTSKVGTREVSSPDETNGADVDQDRIFMVRVALISAAPFIQHYTIAKLAGSV